MEDAIKSIKAYLYERHSNPLTGAYLIIWCIWNFRFLLIILVSDPINAKFSNIENYLFQPSYFFPHSLFWGPIWVYIMPLVLALLYLLALPPLSLRIYEKILEHRKTLNQTKQEIENKTLLTKEESIKMRREIYKISEEYEEQLKKKDEQIFHLKNSLEELSKLNDNESISNDEIESMNHKKILNKLSKEAKEILTSANYNEDGEIRCSETFDGYSVVAGAKEFIPENPRDTAKIKSAILELEKEHLIISKGNKRIIFELTTLGYEIADLIAPPQKPPRPASWA